VVGVTPLTAHQAELGIWGLAGIILVGALVARWRKNQD